MTSNRNIIVTIVTVIIISSLILLQVACLYKKRLSIYGHLPRWAFDICASLTYSVNASNMLKVSFDTARSMCGSTNHLFCFEMRSIFSAIIGSQAWHFEMCRLYHVWPLQLYWNASDPSERGREIAQSLVSLSTKRAVRVRAWLDPLVLEGWNSFTVLLTCSHQCGDWFKKGGPCVIMSV